MTLGKLKEILSKYDNDDMEIEIKYKHINFIEICSVYEDLYSHDLRIEAVPKLILDTFKDEV